MALLGGGVGGAGNPVGGSFTGPAEALEIIGDHAYAYSGEIQIATSDVTHLEFTSGNYYFVGNLEALGPTKPAAPNDGNSALFHLSFNGVGLSTLKMDTEVEDMPSFVAMDIIIPPYTEVKVVVHSGGTTSNMVTSANLTGRIYRTRD